MASAESALIHAGTPRMLGGPAAPPLAPASIFVSWGDPDASYVDERNGNPTWEALEQALGVVERAEAVAFALGQAASMALMLALAQRRERILLPRDGFGGAAATWERRARWASETAPESLIRLSAGSRRSLT